LTRPVTDTTLAQIDAITKAGRRRVAATPTPLIAFGLVNLGGALACALMGRFHLALYGLPAFALAVWLSGRAFAQRARADGVQLSIRPWAITAAALCLGAVTASRLGAAAGIDVVSTVGPFLAQATGLWLLGRWARSEALITVSLIMVAGSGLIGTLASGDLAVSLQFVLYGALLLTAGCSVTMRGRTA
jgi:hypothetical protein